MARRRIGEFELIAKYFAPLAKGFAGAGDLKSDNAFLAADPRRDLVVKTDMIVSVFTAVSWRASAARKALSLSRPPAPAKVRASGAK